MLGSLRPIVLVASLLLLPPLAAADVPATAVGAVEGGTPGAVVIYGQCAVSAGEVCDVATPIASRWQVWISACATTSDATTCSSFTGTVIANVYDDLGSRNVYSVDAVAGASGIGWREGTNTGFVVGSHARLHVETSSLHAVPTVDTGISPSGGPMHVWVTSA